MTPKTLSGPNARRARAAFHELRQVYDAMVIEVATDALKKNPDWVAPLLAGDLDCAVCNAVLQLALAEKLIAVTDFETAVMILAGASPHAVKGLGEGISTRVKDDRDVIFKAARLVVHDDVYEEICVRHAPAAPSKKRRPVAAGKA